MYWQLIEKAPRDGTVVLLAATLEDGRDVCVLGCWEGKWMTRAADGAGWFAVSTRGWEPTHFCRWETPA